MSKEPIVPSEIMFKSIFAIHDFPSASLLLPIMILVWFQAGIYQCDWNHPHPVSIDTKVTGDVMVQLYISEDHMNGI